MLHVLSCRGLEPESFNCQKSKLLRRTCRKQGEVPRGGLGQPSARPADIVRERGIVIEAKRFRQPDTPRVTSSFAGGAALRGSLGLLGC